MCNLTTPTPLHPLFFSIKSGSFVQNQQFGLILCIKSSFLRVLLSFTICSIKLFLQVFDASGIFFIFSRLIYINKGRKSRNPTPRLKKRIFKIVYSQETKPAIKTIKGAKRLFHPFNSSFSNRSYLFM